MKNTSLRNAGWFTTGLQLQKALALLTAFLFCIILNSYTQTTKNMIALSGGAAIPVSDFASKSADNPSAGFANTGYLYDLTYVRFLNNGFGIAAMVRGQSNDMDVDAAIKTLDIDMTEGVTVSSESKPWSNYSILAGVYNSYPMGKADKAFFESRAMIGYMNVTSPEWSTDFSIVDEVNYTLNVKEYKATAGAFTYLFGIGFRYNVGKKVFLYTNVDYQGAKPSFNDVKVSMNDGYSTYDTTMSVSQSISSLNVGIGIGIRF